MRYSLQRFLVGIVALLVLGSSSQIAFAQNSDWEDGKLFVKVKDHEWVDLTYEPGLQNGDAAWQSIISAHSVSAIYSPFKAKSDQMQRTFLVEFDPSNANLTQLLTDIRQISYVDYVEQVPRYELYYTPNDLAPQQWHLQTVQAELAWDINTGSPNVVIAVVDDAVLLTHPDLAANIWVNPGEIPGNNIDDDGNGYVDDVNGYDVADGDNDPNPPATATPQAFSHGTHVAGIAAATTDNNTGIASIGFDSRIMAVKTKNSATVGGGLQAAYAGVDYAIAAGADVINMSWGGGAFSQTYQNLMDLAYQQNIVSVAAAGNSNTQAPMYPASYNHVISVGATDNNDVKSSFSNYGTSIDVMAPGTAIYSTVADPTIDYGFMSGTSMASPLVAGLCALMITKNPTVTVDEIELCLESTSENIDAQNPNHLGLIGAGRINAEQALICVPPITAQFTCDPSFVCPTGAVQFTDLSNNNPTSWEWDFPGGTPSSSTVQNPLITYNTPGTYDVTLIANNAQGSDTLVQVAHVTVDTPTATISGTQSIVAGSSAWLQVSFTGTPGFDFSYTNGTDTFAVNGVSDSIYFLEVTDTTQTDYWLIGMNDTNCVGLVYDTASIDIIVCNQPTFERVYGGVGDESLHGIINTLDGGFMVVGKTNSSGAGGEDLLLMKLDQGGNEMWSQTYGGAGQETTNNFTVIQLSDSSYVVAASSRSFGTGDLESWMLRVDPAGAIIWERVVGQTGSQDDYTRDLTETWDGGLLVVGTYASSTAGGNSDVFAYKMDINGNLEWFELYGGSQPDHSTDVMQVDSGHYLMLNHTRSFGAPNNVIDLWLVKTDTLGTVIWEKYLRQSDIDGAFKMIPGNDGGYIMVGQTNSFGAGDVDFLVLKVDTAGNFLWSKAFGGSALDRAHGLVAAPGGGYLISGLTESFGAGPSNILVLRIDDFGNLMWSKIVGSTGNDRTELWSENTLVTSDNGFIVGGYSNSFGAGDYDLYISKVNACGDGLCNVSDVVVTETPGVFQQGNTFASRASGNTAVPSVSIVAPFTLVNDSTICNNSPTQNVPCQLIADFAFDTACIGDSSHFTDLSVDTAGNSVVDWQWDFGDSTTGTGPNPNHLYTSPGTYTVTLIAQANSPAGCFDTVSHVITVLPGLTAFVTADSIVCAGDSIQLNVDVRCGSGTYAYLWQPGTGLSDSTIANPVVSVDADITYTVFILDATGPFVSDTINLTVDTTCCVSHAAFATNGNFFCGYDSIVFNNVSTDSGNATYLWNFGIGANPSFFVGAVPPPVVYNSPGQYQVSLVLQDDCGSDTMTTDIWIFPDPIANAGADTFICFPQMVQIGDYPVSGYLYEWTPTVGLSDSTISDPIAQVDSTVTYIVEVTDSISGCSSMDTVTINLASMGLSISADTTICPGDAAPLNVLGISCGIAPYTYSWSPAAGLSATNIANPIATPGSTTTYTLEITDSAGNMAQESVTVTVLPVCCTTNALISFQVAPYCEGDTVTFTSQSVTMGAATYEWNFGPNATPSSHTGLVPPPIVYNNFGFHAVTLIVTDTCTSDTATVFVNVVPPPFVQAGADQLICDSSVIMLGVDTLSGVSYSWSPATGLDDPTSPTPFATITGPVTYVVTGVDSASGCVGMDTVSLTYGFTNLNLGPDQLVCNDSTLLLDATSIAGSAYQWQDGSNLPTYLVTTDGLYSVVVSNQCGTFSDSVWVDYQDCNCYTFLPNVFSPNGDGQNDFFYMLIDGPFCEIESFDIYNRWGDIIYTSKDANPRWSGTDGNGNVVSEGTYYYVIVLNGDSYTGHVTVVR